MDDRVKTFPKTIAPLCLGNDAPRTRQGAQLAGGRPPSASGLFFRFLQRLGMAARNHIGGAITQTRTASRHANPTGPDTREAENTGSDGLKPLDDTAVMVGVDPASAPDETVFQCAHYPQCACPGGTHRPDCLGILAMLDAIGRVH